MSLLRAAAKRSRVAGIGDRLQALEVRQVRGLELRKAARPDFLDLMFASFLLGCRTGRLLLLALGYTGS